jgi:hypothetical protein
MAFPPNSMIEDLQINRSRLRLVRLSAICSVLGILATWYVLIVHDLKPGHASDLSFPIWFSPLWFPYLWVWWRLRDTSEPYEVKKSLALAVAWSLFFLSLSIPFLTDAKDEGAWQFAIGLALFTLLQIVLLVGAITTYYSMNRAPRDWHMLVIPLGLVAILIAAVAMIPSLFHNMTAANEASSVGSLRNINTAQTEHAKMYPDKGFASSLRELGPAPGDGLINSVLASGVKNEYIITLTAAPPDPDGRISKYTVEARPRRFDKSGTRSFFTDETGAIRSTSQNRAAAAQDPPL